MVNRIFIYCQVVFSAWLQLKAAIFNFPGSGRYFKSVVKRNQLRVFPPSRLRTRSGPPGPRTPPPGSRLRPRPSSEAGSPERPPPACPGGAAVMNMPGWALGAPFRACVPGGAVPGAQPRRHLLSRPARPGGLCSSPCLTAREQEVRKVRGLPRDPRRRGTGAPAGPAVALRPRDPEGTAALRPLCPALLAGPVTSGQPQPLQVSVK